MNRILIGGVFLLAAAGWAWFALHRTEREPALRVRVRVLDVDGAPVPGGEARSRYGGSWVGADAKGEVRLEAPRVKATIDPLAAVVDAVEARGNYHALRRGRRAQVKRAADGTFEAEVRLEPCGLFRLAVASTGSSEARARVDPDPVRERWRLIEGNDVVRPGQAATWAVFPGAERLWVTLEGPQGTAQQRLYFAAPGRGFLLEKTLFPQRTQPITGRLEGPIGDPPVATRAGVLEVTELVEGSEPIPRMPVRINDDGTFLVDYVGAGVFRLEARCAFVEALSLRDPVVVEGGEQQARLLYRPRPWIEVWTSAEVAKSAVVSLFAIPSAQDALPRNGVRVTERGLQVAVRDGGPHLLSLALRGTDDEPPRAGEVEVEVPPTGVVPATVTLRDLPHGTLVVKFPTVPERGGEARVLPDRSRTVLPRPGETVTFKHVGVGTALVEVRWQHPESAREFLTADVKAGETQEVTVPVERGGRVRLDLTGTAAEDDPRPWALHLLPGATPYGKAEGTLPLLRVRENDVSFLLGDGALRPGAYRAELHATVPDGPPPVPVAFEVRAGEETLVPVKAP